MNPWDPILQLLKQRFRPDQFNIWFKTIQFKALTDDALQLEAPSEYYRNWINSHYIKDIEQAAQEVLQSPRQVILSVKSVPTNPQPFLPLGESTPTISEAPTRRRRPPLTPTSPPLTHNLTQPSASPPTSPHASQQAQTLQAQAQAHAAQAHTAQAQGLDGLGPQALGLQAQAIQAQGAQAQAPPSDTSPHKPPLQTPPPSRPPRPPTSNHPGYIQEPDNEDDKSAGLNPRYTFEAFVVGTSNQLAHAAALAVAAHPAGEFNPLFIYGGVGLGKTHLMQAVGHAAIARSNGRMRVIYRTSEQFMNELITSIERKQMHVFREYYRTQCDILLIDDIQLIAGKERTQEEFFHTFNALYNAGKQIILTSDKTPQEIPALEERLQSRFCWGLIADIQRPDVETRIAILRKKVAREAMLVPPEVVSFLAHRIDTNVRELEGCLKRVNAHALLSGQPLTLDFVQKTLSPLLQPSESHVTPDFILQHVSQFFGVSLDEIRGHSRGRLIAYPRQVAMYLTRIHTGLSYPEIGRIFGKDHTTIINAFQRIERLRDLNPASRNDLDSIERLMHVPNGSSN
jgi:chromosomal replication initiator protein